MGYPVRTLVVGSLFLAACVARGPSTAPPADLVHADTLVAAGCYRCLTEAAAIYGHQLERTRRPSPALVQAAFDTTLLVALRQNELGLPSEPTLAKARWLALLIKPAAGAVAPTDLIELVELAPAETTGLDPDHAAARISRERRARRAALRQTLAAVVAPSRVETYIALAIDCDEREARQRLNATELLARFADVPLLRYRVAACGLGTRDTLRAIRQADPRWVDTTFFEGRAAASGRPPNLRAAIDLFELARPAFADSPAILLALAHAQRGYGDLEPALASYDAVLEMVPTLREALLGRVITLSYLERHAESIETATRMIDLGTWLLSDAYYWRARGRYVLKSLEDAWSDAEHAVQLAANTNVYTLAGVIAYDRKDLATAKDRFHRARHMDSANCTAHSYFALVSAAQNNWPEATPVFSLAMTCFVKASAEAQQELHAIETSDYDPVFKGRLVAEHQKSIKEYDLKAAQSAYNAAQGLLREGKRDEALSHLQMALEHPEMRAKAEALRKLIEP